MSINSINKEGNNNSTNNISNKNILHFKKVKQQQPTP